MDGFLYLFHRMATKTWTCEWEDAALKKGVLSEDTVEGGDAKV